MSDQVPKLSLGATVEASLTPSGLSGKKRPNTQTLAADLCNSQFLKMSCVGGDGKTPRSISITASENRVLRMPDSGLMFKQQRSLQDMLTDIHEDPNGFEEFIQDIRSEMKPHTDVVPSPFDSRCGCLNDYAVDESVIVGRGRFSVVHFATRKRDMLPCALKKINCSPGPIRGGSSGGGGDGKDEGVSPTKCLKEVGLLRSLEHPNIIKYLDSFLHKSELYIILEWAGKGDLKELISDQRKSGIHFQEAQVWTLFSQCSEAIRHMHDKRIIHRDIKPSNVFVMEDGSLKLGDLGLGRYLDLQSILAFSQVGTPLYMSPEVLRGEGHHFASDIWSLGCLLYELATLRSPFQEKGLTMDRLFLKIVKGDYSRKGYSSGRVSRVVESMLNVVPQQRPDIHWVADTSLLARRSLNYLETPKRATVPQHLPGIMAPSPSTGEEETSPIIDHVTRNELNNENAECTHLHRDEVQRPGEGVQGGDIDDDFSVGSRAPSMPRIAETVTTCDASSVCSEKSDSSLYPNMYNEEEVSLMNELIAAESLAEQPIPPIPRHHRGYSNSAKAIHPTDEEGSHQDMEEGSAEINTKDNVKTEATTVTNLEGSLQNCSIRGSDMDLSQSTPRSRPGSGGQRLLSPSSSRRIINLVSGLMNRRGSVKVHTEDDLSSDVDNEKE